MQDGEARAQSLWLDEGKCRCERQQVQDSELCALSTPSQWDSQANRGVSAPAKVRSVVCESQPVAPN